MILNHILFQFFNFRTEADNDNGHEGGGVAKDAGGKEEKG